MKYTDIKDDVRIANKGIAILLICSVTPFIRVLLGGYGLLTWALVPAVTLLFFSIIKPQSSDLRFSVLQLEVIFITFILMVSVLYSPSTEVAFSLESAKVQICTIIIFTYILNKKEENVLILLSFVAAIVFIYCYFFSSDFYMGGIRKYILLQNNVWLDPNMVIASFILPCLWSIQYIISRKKIMIKCLLIMFIALSLYGAYLGSSRGGLAAIIMGTLILICVELKPSGKNLVTTAAIVCVLIIAFFVVRKYIPESLLDRMTFKSVSDSGGSGRFSIYSEYLERFFNESNAMRILFGYGKESCKLYLGKSSHNILIDYIWDLGLVGLFFYIIIMFSILKYTICSKSSLAISCLVATIIWSMTISTNDQLLYWVLLYSSVCLARNNQGRTE